MYLKVLVNTVKVSQQQKCSKVAGNMTETMKPGAWCPHTPSLPCYTPAPDPPG